MDNDFNYEMVLEECFQPANGGRAYYSERVVQRFKERTVAEGFASAYNKEALPDQYYSVRKIKEVK